MIALTYSNVANLAAHPASITVASGQTSGTATITASETLPINSVVQISASEGAHSAVVNIAVNRPYTPTYPIRLCLTTISNAGTCTDTAYQRLTPAIVDRYLTVQNLVRYSAKNPAANVAPRFGVGLGANNYYLLWFDLSMIPFGSSIDAASLQLFTYTWYTANDRLVVRRILDPDGLAAGCASCAQTGWSTLGTPDISLQYTGATAGFRNHTGSGAGTKWRLSDAGSDTDQIQNSLAPADDTKTISGQYTAYTFNTQPSVQAWTNGAVNQGLAFYTTTNSNGTIYPVNLSGNKTQLLVDFTPPAGSDQIAPSTITDLTIACPKLTCTLQWTVPSDNGSVAAYDIRYSTDPITDATFEAAASITAPPINAVIPSPSTQGTVQTMTVVLTDGFTFHFAMRSRDSLANFSPASNDAVVTTPNPRGILPSHPRMLLNTTVADTWNPSLSRLAAIIQRVQGGQPATDWRP